MAWISDRRLSFALCPLRVAAPFGQDIYVNQRAKVTHKGYTAFKPLYNSKLRLPQAWFPPSPSS